MIYDYLIVGGGIIGLTVANEIVSREPLAKVVIIEKEDGLGRHASGRNSGVVHSGIYYPTDSFKARVCAIGGKKMLEFAKNEKIDFRQDGKVILSVSKRDLPAIDKLLLNARNNNIPAERIDSQEVLKIEPHANPNNYGGVFCPSTAVINSREVLQVLYKKLANKGVEFSFNDELLKKVDDNQVQTSQGRYFFDYLVNCSGAHADKVAKMFGFAKNYELIPFKGIYWKLSEKANPKIQANIYPVPDLSLPFLGVHLTKVISNDVYVGPTAIPAFGRENYHLFQGVSYGESIGIVSRLSRMYLSNKNNMRNVTHKEFLKYAKYSFLQSAKKLVPSLSLQDLVPTRKSGIRPQLINNQTNELEMDYILENGETSLHVLNAISPAFTSSFEFAGRIVDKIEKYKSNG